MIPSHANTAPGTHVFILPKWAAAEDATSKQPFVLHSSSKGKQDNQKHIIMDGKSAYTLGREARLCDIELAPSRKVSRLHAAVVHHENGKIYVIDLGSSHGTFVNDSRIDKHRPVCSCCLF